MLVPSIAATHQVDCNGTMEATSTDNDTLTFMTFGDGDFSYSLDMAKYLTSSKEKSARPCHIVATGIDSLKELNAKYRDGPFLLKQLQSLNSESLSVAVYHGVDAVQPPPATEEEDKWKADHVIFNHPHVGTEDAALHSRFLSHFLHTASLHWMKRNGGVLHLTLVKGQYERWKGQEAAERHDLVLLERNDFVPPPGGGHYQHRRHQTGKSFASRATGGSETLTFGRKVDQGKYVGTCLPWQYVSAETVQDFPCPHCDKTFREERSRKSHIKAVHLNEPNKKRKRVEALQCMHCKALNLTRVFPHQQSLDDHIRAKHTSLHSALQPDWVKNTNEMCKQIAPEGSDSSGESQVDSCGSCSICGLTYRTEKDKVQHLKEFVPVPVSELDLQDASATYQCSICKKGFLDQRAQRQHENVCFERSRNQQSLQ